MLAGIAVTTAACGYLAARKSPMPPIAALIGGVGGLLASTVGAAGPLGVVVSVVVGAGFGALFAYDTPVYK
jgi:hypothetical protein